MRGGRRPSIAEGRRSGEDRTTREDDVIVAHHHRLNRRGRVGFAAHHVGSSGVVGSGSLSRARLASTSSLHRAYAAAAVDEPAPIDL